MYVEVGVEWLGGVLKGHLPEEELPLRLSIETNIPVDARVVRVQYMSGQVSNVLQVILESAEFPDLPEAALIPKLDMFYRDDQSQKDKRECLFCGLTAVSHGKKPSLEPNGFHIDCLEQFLHALSIRQHLKKE
jgi:hypothetical protein